MLTVIYLFERTHNGRRRRHCGDKKARNGAGTYAYLWFYSMLVIIVVVEIGQVLLLFDWPIIFHFFLGDRIVAASRDRRSIGYIAHFSHLGEIRSWSAALVEPSSSTAR